MIYIIAFIVLIILPVFFIYYSYRIDAKRKYRFLKNKYSPAYIFAVQFCDTIGLAFKGMNLKQGFILIIDDYFLIIADSDSNDSVKIRFDNVNYIDVKEKQYELIIYYGQGYGVGQFNRYGIEAKFSYSRSFVFNSYIKSKNDFIKYVKENFKPTSRINITI